MRRIDAIFGWIILALGVVHICVTPFVYSQFSQSAVWFAGSGLAGIFAGMLNLIRVRHANDVPALQTFSLITNLLLLAWIVAGTVSMLSELHRNPQALILLIATLSETLFSARRRT
jgi:uncharacterized membrane protein